MQISTTSFNFPDSSCGFGPYLDSLYNVNSPDVWVITENIRGQADRKLGELNFLRYRANNPQFSFNCSFQSGCASLSGFFEVVSYYAECIEFIAVGAPGGGVSAGCPGISYIVECSSSDCCILSRKMCYDSGTGTVRICETVSAGSGSSNCTGNATFTVPTGCSIFHRSGCRNVTCP